MFDQLGDGVFRRRYESLDLNVGVVLGEDGVLLVDTRASHRQARRLLEELKGLTELPVRWVVNTHWHWDHTFGNAVFPDAEKWGHELCAAALSHRGEEMRSGAKEWLPEESHPEIDEVVITPPTRTFSDVASISIGRPVELSYHGLGHTDADIVVRVSDAELSFFGDLIEESAPPSFGDGYPVDWPATLRQASRSVEPTIVPGHGDVVDPSFVSGQLDELDAVARIAMSLISGEIDFEEAVASGPYPPEVMRSAMVRARDVG